MGGSRRSGARLARQTFAPDLLMTDGEAFLFDEGEMRGCWLPDRQVFTMVSAGRRHVMMGAAQIDRYGNQNISCIGDWARPKAQLLGVRGSTRQYREPRGQLLGPPAFATGLRPARGRALRGWVPPGFIGGAGVVPASQQSAVDLRVVVSNLAVLDFQTPDHAMRLRSVHPGVTVADVLAETGFELVVPDDVAVSRVPSAAELDLIRRLDPDGTRVREVP